MVERRYLTEEFVDSQSPPKKGERRVADTLVKGFGLRLWAGPNGGGAAFDLRVKNEKGQNTRRTFQPWRDATPLLWPRESPIEYPASLGLWLPLARLWAIDEKNPLPGRPTLEEEDQSQRHAAEIRVSQMTLGQAACSVLEHGKERSLSQSYVDRLDKLFTAHVPEGLQLKRMSDITDKDLISVLNADALSIGNAKVLRAFVSQVFLRASDFSGGLGRVPHRLRRSDVRNQDHALEQFGEDDLLRVEEALSNYKTEWRQALALRLYLQSEIALSRVLTARWSEINENAWTPYSESESKRYRWTRLDPPVVEIIDEAHDHHRSNSLSSEFLFPSKTGSGAITSVEMAWRAVAAEAAIETVSLRRFHHGTKSVRINRALIRAIRNWEMAN